jgi:hypothetical protein
MSAAPRDAAGHGGVRGALVCSSDAQRGRPREPGVDDPGVGVHAGLPRLRLLVVVMVMVLVVVVVVVVVVRVVLLLLPVLPAARGEGVRRRALLPPVLRPVHLDLLLPALLAAERRVTSARTQPHVRQQL